MGALLPLSVCLSTKRSVFPTLPGASGGDGRSTVASTKDASVRGPLSLALTKRSAQLEAPYNSPLASPGKPAEAERPTRRNGLTPHGLRCRDRS